MKKVLVILTILVLLASFSGIASFADEPEKFNGEIARTKTTLYEGVEMTHITLGADSKYGQNEFWVVEFDPTREDLAIDVTGIGQYSTKLGTTQKTVENFLSTNTQNKVPIAAINGDMWMVTYAHARVEGSGTEYGGYKDAVVTHSLTLPRGLNMYNGEIISSPHTTAETPYEGEFDAFGITADGRTVLGTPKLNITCTNLTNTSLSSIKLTGLNRLPANKAIMLYSDKGCEDNYSLDDAYEVIIDCDYDYCIKQNAVIKGKVTQICKPGEANVKMKENRLILTARGSTQIGKLDDFAIGDEIEFSFVLKGNKNDNDIWQEVTNAVGGHMQLVKNGKSTGISDASRYPTSIIGNKADGSVVFVTIDGRQTGYSVGFKICDMDDILLAFGVQNAFLLDGGGSATMVNIKEDGNYELTNHPCDKDSNGNYGQARTVVNSIILSYIAPEATEEPTLEPTATPAPTNEAKATEAPKSSGCGGVIGGSTIITLSLISVMVLKKKKKH